jgi:long-chain acyl-CoA synthetase
MDKARLQELLDTIEFHQVLKMRVVDVLDGNSVRIHLPFSVSYVHQRTIGNYHGGVLAALADVAGTLACMVNRATSFTTAHLSIDFLKSPTNCDLYARAKVIKSGRKNSVADIEITGEGKVVYAVARGSWSPVEGGWPDLQYDTSKPSPNANLGLLGIQHIADNESKTAVINIRADGSICKTSYGDLHASFDRAARLFTSAGLQIGDRLALATSNRTEFLIAAFGALRAGITVVPLNIRLGPDALGFILHDAACKAVVADTALPATLVSLLRAIDGPRWTIAAPGDGWECFNAALANEPSIFAAPTLGAQHPAMIAYTAGSTGVPKGVLLTHGGQIWLAAAMQRVWPAVMTPEARAMVAVPLFHKNALAVAVKPMLHRGGSMVIVEEFKPRRVLEATAQFHCTYSTGVPAMYAMLLREQDLISTLDLRSYRTVIIGSAPCQPELLRALEAQLGVEVIQGYGLTECAPILVTRRDGGSHPPLESCGTPVPGMEVRLDSGNHEANAVEGELWVRGPNLTPGYLNRPDLNAERFQDGWLKTGDIFCRDAEGYYFFRGRVDDMFFCGGENVYPLEVEDILLRHPSVSNAAVVPLDHAIKGQIPAALVALKQGKSTGSDELKEFYLCNGPSYSHPRVIRIVEELPLSGTGKVDRAAVRNALLAAATELHSGEPQKARSHD